MKKKMVILIVSAMLLMAGCGRTVTEQVSAAGTKPPGQEQQTETAEGGKAQGQQTEAADGGKAQGQQAEAADGGKAQGQQTEAAEDGKAQSAAADMTGYTLLRDKEHVFTQSSFSEIAGLTEGKGTGIFYIGYPECKWCQSMIGILNEAGKEAGQNIGYVALYDTEGNKLYDREEADAFVEFAKDFLETDEEGEPTLYSPYVFVLKDGNIVSYHVGTLDEHDLEQGMTEGQEAELSAIYREMMAAAG